MQFKKQNLGKLWWIYGKYPLSQEIIQGNFKVPELEVIRGELIMLQNHTGNFVWKNHKQNLISVNIRPVLNGPPNATLI